MYSKQEMITIQKKFSRWHYALMVFLVIYTAFNLTEGIASRHAREYASVIVCSVFLIEFLVSLMDFFHSTLCIIVVKYLQLIALSFMNMSKSNDFFMYILITAVYIMISLELSVFIDMSETNRKISFTIACVVPYACSATYYMISYKNYYYLVQSLLVIGFIGIIVSAVTKIINSKLLSLYDALLAKERIIDKAYDNNKEILEKQQKLFYVNEQLGIKKIEVESANKKILMNSIEMNLQNKLMEYYSSTFDIQKIQDYFGYNVTSTFDIQAIYVYDTEKSGKGVFYGQISDEDEFAEGIYKNFIEKVEPDNFKSIRTLSSIDVMDYAWLENEALHSCAIKGIIVSNKLKYIYFLFSTQGDYFKGNVTYYDNILHELQVVANNVYIYSLYYDMAKKDGLTGAYNRRYLNEILEQYKSMGFPKELTMAVAMFDIDNFKHINDTYGHLFGDEVIKMVASTIKNISEELDGTTFRYGGEEFVAMFVDQEFEAVKKIIEKVHEAIKSNPVESGENCVNVNVSIGIAGFPETSADPLGLDELADKAMYYSKTHGKGRITVDGEYDKE